MWNSVKFVFGWIYLLIQKTFQTTIMRFSVVSLILFLLFLLLLILILYKYSSKVNKQDIKTPRILFISFIAAQTVLVVFLYVYFLELHDYFFAIANFFHSSYDEIVIFLICILAPYVFILLICYILYLRNVNKRLRRG